MIELPSEAVGLRLARIAPAGKCKPEALILCEAMRFANVGAVTLVFNRARISGRVEVGGKIENHFADILDADGDMIETVALDAKSYAKIKNKWARCKVERSPSKKDAET